MRDLSGPPRSCYRPKTYDFPPPTISGHQANLSDQRSEGQNLACVSWFAKERRVTDSDLKRAPPLGYPPESPRNGHENSVWVLDESDIARTSRVFLLFQLRLSMLVLKSCQLVIGNWTQ